MWVWWLACGPPGTESAEPTDGAGGGTGASGLVGEPLACADPAGHVAAPWTRTEIGVDWRFEPDWRTAGWDLRFGARGVLVADFSGDGHQDVLVPQFSEPLRLLLGDGTGALVEGLAPMPEEPALTGLVGGSAADFDGDGDLDAMLYGQLSPPVLLTNDGHGAFQVAVHAEWDRDFLGCGGSAAWADFDLDGDLDLFYGRLGAAREDDVLVCGSRMLVNDGSGAFTDASDAYLDPIVQEVHALAAGWGQYDADPWPELYIAADAVFESSSVPIEGHSDKLVDNDGSGLVYRPEAQMGLDIKLAGMGLGAGDLNEDGLTDVAISGWGEIKLLRSAGTVWVDQSQSWGIVPRTDVHQVVAWGGEFVDVDANGELDLVMGFGATEGDSSQQPDALYLQRSGVWTEEAAAWAFDDPVATRGFVTADLNEDGWPDLVKRELGGVVVTHLSACGEASVLVVRLLDEDSGNRFAVGALVRVRTADVWRSRMVYAGSTSMASGGPAEVMFGLGDAAGVDEVEVIWPDGERVSYGPAAVDQRLTVNRAMAL